MGQIDNALSGLTIADPLNTWLDRLTGTLSFNEAEPRPGSPIASTGGVQAQPAVSGGQDTKIDLYAVRSGNPNRSHDATKGANWLYRESAGTWMGWNYPNLMQNVDSLGVWATASDYLHIDAVTVPGSQDVVCVMGDHQSTSNQIVQVFDMESRAWSGRLDIDPQLEGTNFEDVAICILPSERIIVALLRDDGTTDTWDIFTSTDGGYGYTLVSSTPFGATVPTRMGSETNGGVVNSTGRTHMVADANGDILLIRTGTHTGVQFCMQWVSTDQGASFTQVGDNWSSTPPTAPTLLKLASGRIGMIWQEDIGTTLEFSTIASAHDSLESATSVEINTNASTEEGVAGYVDHDGVVYAYRNDRYYTSEDEGDTWEDSTDLWNETKDGYARPYAATAANGIAFVFGTHEDDAIGDYNYCVWCWQCGGWSNLQQRSWSGDSTSEATWFPFMKPTTILGLTETTSGGSISIATQQYMSVTTTAQTFNWTRTYAASYDDLRCLVDIDVTSGGDITAEDVSFNLVTGNGTNSRAIFVTFTATQFSVYDKGAGTILGSAVTHGSADGRVQVCAYLNGSTMTVSVWWRLRESDAWTLSHNASVPTDAGAVSSSITWGHIGSTTAVSKWFMVCKGRETTEGTGEPIDNQTSYRGKPLSVAPYPIPGIGPEGKVAWLSMLTGPAFRGDLFDIDPVHDYPLSNLYPDISPSPRQKWRAQDTAAHTVMAWNSNGGRSMSVTAMSCNVPSLELYGDGGLIGTVDFDADFTDVSYAMTNNTFKAHTSGTSGDRYIQENELAGGWVDLDSGNYRKIISNTAGEWTTGSDSTIAKAVITFEGSTVGPAATGTCKIYSKDACLVIHNVGDYATFSVKTPSSSTYESFWEIGAIHVGEISFAGQRHDHGWTWGRDANADERTDAGGTTYVVQKGAAPRTLSISWPQGMDQRDIRTTTGLDYLKATAGDPVAVYRDVPFWQLGVLEKCKSGELITVVIPYIPDADTTLTDPTRFLYSRLSSSVQINNVLGDEVDEGEVYRADSMTFKEVV